MAWYDRLLRREREKQEQERMRQGPPEGSYADRDPRARQTWETVHDLLDQQEVTPELAMIRSILERRPRASAISLGLPDVGFKGVRQQLFQRFNLVDLYAIAHNNSVVKTAIGNLKQEVFRRGMTWEPAFHMRDKRQGRDYEQEELENLRESDEIAFDALAPFLVKPDVQQRVKFEQVMQNVNIFGQTFLRLLQSLEDDMNIADDAFIFISSTYEFPCCKQDGWHNGEEHMVRDVKQLFRLDPVFVEFDTDQENRPGFAHHVCLLHREDLLVIPPDENWQEHWQGKCPLCNHTTFPVVYRYAPYKGTFGTRSGVNGPDQQSTYLVAGEVIHSSKFSPSELYGYSPILSIYEKALSLIGMDRYLYDYFFERQIPQGVVTTVTDNPEDLEMRKEQMLAEVLNNPHYIPWLAVSSKTGQGRTEFVRFAYSLDELQFLPVQEQIEKSVAALYGVPGLFMGREEQAGGLNNESQQLTRMSRGAQLSQDVYNTEVLPQILGAFGITDWQLKLNDAEEYSEQFEVELKQRKAQWANTFVSMGFGVQYNQDTDEFTIMGEVKSKEEQEKAQQEAQMQMGGGLPGMGGGEEGGGRMPEGQEGGEGADDGGMDELDELLEELEGEFDAIDEEDNEGFGEVNEANNEDEEEDEKEREDNLS